MSPPIQLVLFIYLLLAGVNCVDPSVRMRGEVPAGNHARNYLL